METICQNTNLVLTKKTIQWLVNNTSVKKFDPISFDGYQRDIDLKHCEKIVNYLQTEHFILPTPIICSSNEVYDENNPLYIVDGQHRVEAFKILRKEHLSRYNEIKNYELPVIILNQASTVLEVETFININKTSKKVDTSLAYVLRHNLSNEPTLQTLSRAEYLSVELARELNQSSIYWKDKILFEGSIRNSAQYISLNAFVKATRVFVNMMSKKELISLSWGSNDEIKRILGTLFDLINYIMDSVYQKWPDLVSATLEDKQVIQGALGYTSIIRAIINIMNGEQISTVKEIKEQIKEFFSKTQIDSNCWRKGNYFSKFTSESGYKHVSEELIKSIRN